MSKSIKVSEEVYDQLERLRHKRETFSDVVERHIRVRGLVLDAAEILQSAEKFWSGIRKSENRRVTAEQLAGLGTNTGDDESPGGG